MEFPSGTYGGDHWPDPDFLRPVGICPGEADEEYICDRNYQWALTAGAGSADRTDGKKGRMIEGAVPPDEQWDSTFFIDFKTEEQYIPFETPLQLLQ